MISTAMLLAAAANCAAQSRDAEQLNVTHVSGPGYSLTVSVTPDATSATVGEPLFLSLTVRNDARDRIVGFLQPTGLDNLALPPKDGRHAIECSDSAGRHVRGRYSDVGAFAGNHRQTDEALSPGASATHRLFHPDWCEFDAPGTYDVNVRRILSVETGLSVYTDVEVDLSFALTILSRDEAQLAALIERYGVIVGTGDMRQADEAARALSAINDPAVIPHLKTALSGTNSRATRYGAARALARFDVPEAHAALALGLQDDDRLVAREALRGLQAHGRVADAVRDLGGGLARTADPVERIPIIHGLMAAGIADAGDWLVTQLEHPDALTRIRVIHSLADLGRPYEVERLSAAIRDLGDDPQVLTQTFSLVRAHGGADAIRALIGALELDDPTRGGPNQGRILGALGRLCGAPPVRTGWWSTPRNARQIESNRGVQELIKSWTPDAVFSTCP